MSLISKIKDSRISRTARNILLATSMLFATGDAIAQSTLQGTVRKLDQNTGTPIQNAKIVVDDGMSAFSDASGNYTINGISDGAHNIKVIHIGSIGINQDNYSINGSTRFNVSLPDSVQNVTLGSGPLILSEFTQLYRSNTDLPNSEMYEVEPVITYLSNALNRDSTLFRQAIGAGTGNWQDSQVGSVENMMKRPLRIFTSDSAAAYDHGVIVLFNAGSNSSNSSTYNNGFIRSAICSIKQVSSIATAQHELAGRADRKPSILGWLSNMNLPAINWTLKDNIYSWVAENHLRAKQRGEQDADLIGFNYNSALPIQLSDFNASSLLNVKTGHVVRLDWTTASETNNYGFNVQRSKDNKNYVTLENKFVKGNGTTLEQHKYSETDTTDLDKPYYRLEQIDLDGTRNYTEGKQVITTDVNSDVPVKTSLAQNYPNPFNPETTIEYQLQKAGKVKLSIYNALGQEVAKITDANMPAGKYSTKWNAGGLASGLYMYRLEADGQVQTRKMILVK